jgi:hypothetical protein
MGQQSIAQSSHGGVPSLRSRLLLGDWGPVVRDPLDVLRLLYVAGAIAWVVVGGAAWTVLSAPRS